MPKEFVNNKPFAFECHNGFRFTSDTSDLKHGINVPLVLAEHPKLLAESIAEMISFHAIHVWPNLNGFAGYDCLRFTNLS